MAEFKNPNQRRRWRNQDNRSLLVMMVVMFGVIFGLQYWRAQAQPADGSALGSGWRSDARLRSRQLPPAAAARSAGLLPLPQRLRCRLRPRATTVVENELYRITFSNRGGQATSWILKKYHDNDGKPLDLVHDGAAKLLAIRSRCTPTTPA